LTRPDYEKLRSLYFDAPVTKGKKNVPFFSDEIFVAKSAEKELGGAASQRPFERGQKLESEVKTARNSLAAVSKNHTERFSSVDFGVPKEMERRVNEPPRLYEESKFKRPPLKFDEVENIDSDDVSVFDTLKDQIFGSVPKADFDNESVLDEVASALPHGSYDLDKGTLESNVTDVLETLASTPDSVESAPSQTPVEAVYDEDLEYLDALTNKGLQSFDASTRGISSLGEIFAEIVAGEKQSVANFDASVFDANVQMIYGDDVCDEVPNDVGEISESGELEVAQVEASELVMETKEPAPVVVEQMTPPVMPAVHRRRRISVIDIILFLTVLGLIAFLIFTSL